MNAQEFVKYSLIKGNLEVFQKEGWNKDFQFTFKTSTGKEHDISVQSVNLDKDRSLKIPKSELPELSDNLWIALVLYMKEMEPVLYLIPSKVFESPDNYIFFNNDQGERFSHLSNYEIKVFSKAIPELSKYSFENMVSVLV